jgi:RND family efflux transporter MFP subunit
VATAALRAIEQGDVTIDPRRQQLIGVRTVRVQRSALETSVRTAGRVQYDETRMSDINLKVEGWVLNLYAASTGQRIHSGQRLLSLYSPELLTLQTDYLLALKTRDQVRDSAPDALPRADELLTTARRQLELRDVSQADIHQLDESREPLGTMTLLAPGAGVVIQKHVVKGLHVVAGESLYTVADLSLVWVEADVPEIDAALVRVGTGAKVTVDAYPGQQRAGRVIRVSPYLDEKSRTNQVTIEFANEDGRLKPGMSANVEFTLPAGEGLSLPVDAVLDSGTEQIAFVDQGAGRFQPRRVTVGHRLGARVEILAGLVDGEEVATGATFLLDSESQLRDTLPEFQPPGVSAPDVGRAEPPQITLRTVPDPPKAAETEFEITIGHPARESAAGSEVTVELFAPAMPSMNMPSMRSVITLAHVSEGVFRGSGSLAMPGHWDATVVVHTAGVEVARQRFPLIAQ